MIFDNISRDLGIKRGRRESCDDFYVRLAYSAAGRVAMLSLLDAPEDEQTSITHFKNRVKRELKALLIAADISEVDNSEIDTITDEIYREYSETGYLYHAPNRIEAAYNHKSIVDNIIFIRGAILQRNVLVSGLGYYLQNSKLEMDYPEIDFIEMFNILPLSLEKYYKKMIDHREWESFEPIGRVEYLRVRGTFSRGYWNQIPDRDGTISLLRAGDQGREIYYLYRCMDEGIQCSPLPEWMTHNYEYRQIACAILNHEKTLPSTVAVDDGKLVRINIGYLFPSQIQNLIMLYSWPDNIKDPQRGFRRWMDIKVWKAIRSKVEPLGYTFIEEHN